MSDKDQTYSPLMLAYYHGLHIAADREMQADKIERQGRQGALVDREFLPGPESSDE